MHKQRYLNGLLNKIHHSSNHANRPILFHSIVSHRIGEANGVVQVVVDALNLGDAGTTHVGNRIKVQATHNPLRNHVVPETVGYDVSGCQVPNLSRLHHPFEW